MSLISNSFGLCAWRAASFGQFANPYPKDSDEYWMAEAFHASLQEIGKSSPNPSVGCAIVKDGEMIAQGATEAYGGRHGERVALAKISKSDLCKSAKSM